MDTVATGLLVMLWVLHWQLPQVLMRAAVTPQGGTAVPTQQPVLPQPVVRLAGPG